MTLLESLGVALPQTGSEVGDAALRVGTDPLTLAMVAALGRNRFRAGSQQQAMMQMTQDLESKFGRGGPLSSRVGQFAHEMAATSADDVADRLKFAGLMSDRTYWHKDVPPMTHPFLDADISDIQPSAKQQTLFDFLYGPRVAEPLPLPQVMDFGDFLAPMRKDLERTWAELSSRFPGEAARVEEIGPLLNRTGASAQFVMDNRALRINPTLLQRNLPVTLDSTIAHELVHAAQPPLNPILKRMTEEEAADLWPAMLYQLEHPAYVREGTAYALDRRYRQATAQNAIDRLNLWRNLEMAGLGAGASWNAFMGGEE